MLFKTLMNSNSSTKIRVYVSDKDKQTVVDCFIIDYCAEQTNFSRKWYLERVRATVECVSAGKYVLNYVAIKDTDHYKNTFVIREV